MTCIVLTTSGFLFGFHCFLIYPILGLCFVEFLLCALREGAEKKMTTHYTVLKFQSAVLCIILSILHTFRLTDQIIFYSNYAKLYWKEMMRVPHFFFRRTVLIAKNWFNNLQLCEPHTWHIALLVMPIPGRSSQVQHLNARV